MKLLISLSLIFLFIGCGYKNTVETQPISVLKPHYEIKEFYSLKELVNYGLKENYDVAIFKEKRKQIHAQLLQNINFPTASINTQRNDSKNFESKIDSSQISTGLNVSYELDFLDKYKDKTFIKEKAKEINEIQLNNLENEIIYTIVNMWLNLHIEYQKERIYKEKIALYQKILLIMQQKYYNQEISMSDILQQKTAIESLNENLLKSIYNQEIYKTSLNTITSASINYDILKPIIMENGINELKYNGNSIEILEHPEVEIAYLELLQQEKAIAIAIKEKCPTLSLGATLSNQALNVSSLFDTWIGAFTTAISYSFFNNVINEKVEEEKSLYSQKSYSFFKTYFGVWVRLQKIIAWDYNLQEQLKSVSIQQKLNQKTLEINLKDYVGGQITSINLLQTQSSVLDDGIKELTIKKELVLNNLLIHKELMNMKSFIK